MSELRVRLATPADLNFVLASWFESYWTATARADGIAFEDYKAGFNKRTAALLQRGLVQCAFFEAIPEEVLGYVVREAGVPVAHYAYVKSDFRRQRIAKNLLRNVEVYTHKTRLGEKLAQSLNLRFDPFRLEFP